MAFGTLKADTLTHSTAGSVATNFVVNGSAKSWLNFNGTGTVAVRDSFNHSSLTDVSGGNYTVTMSSAMSNADYSFSGSPAESASGAGSRVVNFGNNADSGTLDPNFTTTAYSVNTFFCNSDASESDVTFIANQIFGELA
tara:strand:- start:207 stop:626 length:420 start_codon:yes stop_codon:yes gene_type:complete